MTVTAAVKGPLRTAPHSLGPLLPGTTVSNPVHFHRRVGFLKYDAWAETASIEARSVEFKEIKEGHGV